MKKIFSLFTSLVMVISLVGVLPIKIAVSNVLIANASEYESYGNYRCKLLENNTLEIERYFGHDSFLTIPSKLGGKAVTSIAYSGYYDDGVFNEELMSVAIPNSITVIGHNAFKNCSNLVTVTMPNNLCGIYDQAFQNCTNLTDFSIPDKVRIIGKHAFDGCESIKKITLPNTLTSISDYAFNGCKSLSKLTIPYGIKSIGKNAFDSCALNDLSLPNSLTTIKEYAFYNNNLKIVTIPKNVSNIEECAFGYVPGSTNHLYWYLSSFDKKVSGFKIKCYSNTSGLSYAQNNGFKYDILNAIPANVSGFKVSATSAQAIKLTWNKVSGATGYVVYRAINGKWQRVGVVKSNAFYEGKLKSGTNYRYAVKAYKTVNGTNTYSVSYPTLWTSTKPATVNFRIATANRKVAVRWNKVTGATGYIVYYKTSTKGNWQRLRVTTGTGYTKTGLVKGRTYWFTVRAYRTVCGKNYFGAFTTKSIKVK